MPVYKNCRVVSYETLLFDTVDGDLDTAEYALDGNGTGYHIRTVPKNQGQFEWIDLNFKDMAGNVHSITGLSQVKVIPGNAYYDEFLTAAGITALASSLAMTPPSASLSAGHTIRVRTTKEAYDAGRYVKDTPVPSRDETVTTLPPAILGIPPEKQYNAPLMETINEFLFQKTGQHHSIGFDATSASAEYFNISSYSWNHTCGASANLLVFGDAHYMAAVDQTVTAASYNSVAMTYVRSDYYDPYGTGKIRTTIYRLLAPATGSAKSVAVTLSGTISGDGCGGVVSYSGAKQSGQPDAHNGATGKSTTASVIVTTVADNCWVFSVVRAQAALTCGNTQRWLVNTVDGGSDTNAPKTPAGTQTMSWTPASSAEWVISAASFAPAVITTWNESLTDGIKSGDTSAPCIIYGVILTDGLKSGDTLASQATYNVAITDGIKGGDASGSQATLINLLVDGIKSGDTLASNATYNVALTDGIKSGDISGGLGVFAKALTDGIKVGDSSLAGLLYLISLTDGIKAGDTTIGSLLLALALTDGIKVGDTLANQVIFKNLLTDGIKVGDTSLAKLVLSLFASDGIKTGDTALDKLVLSLFLSDGIKTGDTNVGSLVLNLTLADGTKLGDTTISQLVARNSLTDGVKLGDSALTQCLFNITLSDGIKLGDITVSQLVANPSLTDGIKLSDLATTTLIVNAMLTDGIKLSDSPIAKLVLGLTISDGVKLGDIVTTISIYNLLLSDGIKLGDTPLAKLVFNLLLTDGIKLGDVLTLLSLLRSRRYGDTAPDETSIITTKPPGAGRYG